MSVQARISAKSAPPDANRTKLLTAEVETACCANHDKWRLRWLRVKLEATKRRKSQRRIKLTRKRALLPLINNPSTEMSTAMMCSKEKAELHETDCERNPEIRASKLTAEAQDELTPLVVLRRHGSKDRVQITIPTPIMTPPSNRATNSPLGASFSIAARPASAAIQSRFMAPPTNRSAIKPQQHPIQ